MQTLFWLLRGTEVFLFYFLLYHVADPAVSNVPLDCESSGVTAQSRSHRAPPCYQVEMTYLIVSCRGPESSHSQSTVVERQRALAGAGMLAPLRYKMLASSQTTCGRMMEMQTMVCHYIFIEWVNLSSLDQNNTTQIEPTLPTLGHDCK